MCHEELRLQKPVFTFLLSEAFWAEREENPGWRVSRVVWRAAKIKPTENDREVNTQRQNPRQFLHCFEDLGVRMMASILGDNGMEVAPGRNELIDLTLGFRFPLLIHDIKSGLDRQERNHHSRLST